MTDINKPNQVSFIYMWLGVIFTTCIVAANILETKVVEIGPLTVTGGMLCFPVSYIIGDVVTEIYGFRSMMRLVFMGLLMNLIVVILGNIAVLLPAPSYWEGEEGFNFIFSFAPRITLASFLAFVIGSSVNSKVMERMHHRHGEGRFCLRAIFSTILGEGADSIVFFPIAFLGVIPFIEIVKIASLQIVLKTLYEIIVLPITMTVVRIIEKKENIHTATPDSEEPQGYSGQSIALVLADGGAKGYAHIGAIKALEEEGMKIHSIAGASMGALVGGLYAAGKIREGYQFMKSVDVQKILSLSDLSHIGADGLMAGEDLYDRLHEIIGDVMIEDLPVSYCAIATDIDTGQEKVFTSGKLMDAIRASISMPGVFRPYIIDGRRYVDGALTNGLPINRVKREEGDIVVAINLDTYESSQANTFTHALKHGGNGLFPTLEKFRSYRLLKYLVKAYDVVTSENVVNILINSFFISIKQNKRLMAELTQPDIYINIDLEGYDTHNFNNAKEICTLGYRQVKEQLASLKK